MRLELPRMENFAFQGYAYYSINPWRPRHDEIIRRMVESGLVEKWKEQTWYRMKTEYQEELRRTGQEPIKFEFKPLVFAMSLDAFQVMAFQITVALLS